MSDLYVLLKDYSDFGYFGDLDKARWGGTAICKNRDSDIITTTNFDGITGVLLEEFPDSFEIMQSNHWAVGWVDQLMVDTKDQDALDRLQGVVNALEDYPVWDEAAVSEAEMLAEEEDFNNNIKSDLEKLWEKDESNIELPDEHYVFLKPPNVGDGPDDVLWTTTLGGYFNTASDAHDFICEELELDEPEFPSDTITDEKEWEAYRIAMEATNQYWEENSSPIVEDLYPIWKENLK